MKMKMVAKNQNDLLDQSGAHDFLQEIIEAFHQKLPEILRALRTSFIRRVAHSGRRG